jgi:GDSL-like Lipase/Acylhydrolase family/Bacterial TSP3 repeat
MFKQNREIWALVVVMAVTMAPQAYACGKVGPITDRNCDGKAVVTILGDSIPAGFGDKVNGGYVTRIQRSLPTVEFRNFAEPGLKTGPHLLKLTRAFRTPASEPNSLRDALIEADVVIQDLGRNDRWDFGLPAATYRNLKRAVTIIQKGVAAEQRVKPVVVTAVMMLPNRGSQGPWVKELNELILNGSTEASPSDVRLDLVSKRLLSPDQIHPTAAGYAALASALKKYIVKTLPKHLAKAVSDDDSDGVYDDAESIIFGTDPQLVDTDGDGVSDGDEILVAQTDPLSPPGIQQNRLTETKMLTLATGKSAQHALAVLPRGV